MSGTIVDNILRQSGSIAATPAGLSWQDVVTASTVTVEAGKGYWINTTSNACTITLPASAEAGDNIVIVDYARTWGTNAVTLDSNGLNFQGEADTNIVEYTTDGQSVNLVYSDSTKGWIPLEDDVVADEPVAPPTQKGLFAYGNTGSIVSLKNLLGSNGVIAADVTGVGTGRQGPGAAGYGTGLAIFAYGEAASSNFTNVSNKVSFTGVVASDTSGVGTGRSAVAAASYGGDKGIFAFGNLTNHTNRDSNTGTIATDGQAAGTGRRQLAAGGYSYSA